jgi:hypothetical protein
LQQADNLKQTVTEHVSRLITSGACLQQADNLKQTVTEHPVVIEVKPAPKLFTVKQRIVSGEGGIWGSLSSMCRGPANLLDTLWAIT